MTDEPPFSRIVAGPHMVTMRRLIRAASEVTGVPVEVISGKGRADKYVRIRACIIQVANQQRIHNRRNLMRWTYPAIAKALGYRDHSPVMHAIQQWDRYCRVDPTLPGLVVKIRELAERPDRWEDEPKDTEVREKHDYLYDVRTAPESVYLKPKNDFRADSADEADGGHLFHARMAKASRRFVKALLEAKCATRGIE